MAKIFIYNILQQRLDRLLLAVLRRKRGRRVHEWGCSSGSGSAGRSAGGGAEDQAKGEETSKTQKVRTPPTAHKLKLGPATRWEVRKRLFNHFKHFKNHALCKRRRIWF